MEDGEISSESAVFIYYGGDFPINEPDFILAGTINDRSFGHQLVGGDFNADGYSDIITNYFDENEEDNGKVNCYFGGPNFDDIPDLIFFDEEINDNYAYKR